MSDDSFDTSDSLGQSLLELAEQLQSIAFGEDSENDFSKLMEMGSLKTEMHVHALHSFIVCMPKESLSRVILEYNILGLLDLYMIYQSEGSLWKPPTLLIRKILELVEISLKFGASQINRDCSLPLSQHILSAIYDIYQKGFNQMPQEIQQLFLRCLARIDQIEPGAIDRGVYIEMLAKTPGEITQFKKVFIQYLSSSVEYHNYKTIEMLLKGFKLRIPIMLSQEYKNTNKVALIRLFSCFVDFLSRLPPKSPWLNIMFQEQYSVIKKALFNLTTDKLYSQTMARMMDQLIITYINCQFANHIKFEFILEVLKFIFQKASIVYGMMDECTNFIRENQQFIQWFYLKELRMDNQREIVDIYFANKFALEFIICMMLYSIYHFPMCIPEVAGLLRVVNFLEETKYFVDCETIKNLITILYINIGEEDICRELGGHFQDAVTSLKL